MTTPVLEHVLSLFPDGTITQPVGDVDGITLHLVISMNPAVNLVFTDGVAGRIPALFPQELAVFALPGQWRQAAEIVAATTINVLERQRGLILGDTISGTDPILPGTTITCVLAYTNPYLDPMFDALPSPEGNGYARQIVTLVPLTSAEADRINSDPTENAADSFMEYLESQGIDETDLTRTDE